MLDAYAVSNLIVNGRHWRAFMVICIRLAFSAFYELIEWWIEFSVSFSHLQTYGW